MAVVTPTKSTSLVPYSSRLSNSQLNLVSFRKTHLRFRSQLHTRAIITWEKSQHGKEKTRRADQWLRNGEDKKATGGGLTRCRAEGVERGFLVGGGCEGWLLGVPERLKVVVLVAFVMCLCNADRVVMSVSIVPLAVRHGWSTSFLGIVQVTTSFLSEISVLLLFFFAFPLFCHFSFFFRVFLDDFQSFYIFRRLFLPFW
uniref:Anion transporter 4, chloroplastic n=1 Tax=Nelumbo nucifera TaxID=4432 RepID=A0A822Y630_NELNU|nr:TPA_asm: hypothetical protein HUJ06_028094 [Nelumbo nucifera]